MPKGDDLLCGANKTKKELVDLAKEYNKSHEDEDRIEYTRMTKKTLIDALMERGECVGDDFELYDDDDDDEYEYEEETLGVIEDDDEDNGLETITGASPKAWKEIRKILAKDARKRKMTTYHRTRSDPNAVTMTNVAPTAGASNTFYAPTTVSGPQPIVQAMFPTPTAPVGNFSRTPHPLGTVIFPKSSVRAPPVAVQETKYVFMYGSWKLSDMQNKCNSPNLVQGKPAILHAYEMYFGGAPVCSVTIKRANSRAYEVYGTLYALPPDAAHNLHRALSAHYKHEMVNVSVLENGVHVATNAYTYRRKAPRGNYVGTEGCRPTTSQLDEIQAAIDATWGKNQKLIANYF